MTKQLEAQFYFGAVIDHDGECQRVSDEEAQFWTVYERNADGLSFAICDCTHRNDAVAATERFNALIAALEQSQSQSSKWLEAYHKAASLGARYEERIAELEASQLAVKLPEPDFKKLARGLVDNLVDCGGLDGGVYEQYVIWAEKECRVSFGGTVQGDE